MALYQVPGGDDGEGSFSGYYREDDGTLRHLTGDEFSAYLAGGNTPEVLTQGQFGGLLTDAKTKKVSGAPTGYLSGNNQTLWDSKGPPKPAKTSPEMTNLLARFGVDYQNAPAPTPAMLAFMRGIGLSLDTAADAKQRTTSRIKERTTSTLADIDSGNERTKTNILGDLVRRGVLRSGEANTRYGQQAENVARSKSEALRAQAEGIDAADISYNSARDQYRQQALERTINAETEQATRAASSTAQAESFARQDAASELAYARQKEAEERMLKQQEDLIKTYGMVF